MVTWWSWINLAEYNGKQNQDVKTGTSYRRAHTNTHTHTHTQGDMACRTWNIVDNWEWGARTHAHTQPRKIWLNTEQTAAARALKTTHTRGGRMISRTDSHRPFEKNTRHTYALSLSLSLSFSLLSLSLSLTHTHTHGSQTHSASNTSDPWARKHTHTSTRMVVLLDSALNTWNNCAQTLTHLRTAKFGWSSIFWVLTSTAIAK